MPTTTTIQITAQNFTGKSFAIDIDPTHTVHELKALIVAAGNDKSVNVPGLEYKGHELRDTRTVDHYELANNDVLHILPPSKLPKIALELVREDGIAFDITVSSDITITKLKEDIKIEEKIAVRHLKLVNSQGFEDQAVTLLELHDDKAISEYSLEGKKVLVNDSVWEAVWAPFAIDILVSMDDQTDDSEGSRIGVVVRLDQTLASFKERLLNYHSCHCAEHSLILFGRELKDDRQTLGDLGFVEGCTVHAVAAIEFSVMALTGEDYTFVLKVATRISEIRKLLRKANADVGDQDNYAFSLDGVHTLQESRTLLDLNLYSVSHRHELVGATRTIGEERLDGGNVAGSTLMPPDRRIPEEVEERRQIDESLNAVIDSDERSDFQLFVGAAEWTRDPGAREDNYDLFVEVKVDGASEVLRTHLAKTAHWDQELTITGRPSSTIRIEIRSVAHNSSESLSVVRVETSVENLLEMCADDDLAALELAIAPLVSATINQATVAGGLKWSRHFTVDSSIGIITVKISRSSKSPPCLLQLRDIRTFSVQQMKQLGRRTFEQVKDRGPIDSDISTLADNIEDLSNGYRARFEKLGDLADLENSIGNLEQAIAFTPDDHPNKPNRLSDLGACYCKRFERLGDLADLENSVMNCRQAVALAPDDHRNIPGYLTNLGASYKRRFERLGELADVDNSIASLEQALALTPDGHPDKPRRLTNLGTGYHMRFKRLGELADLENGIASWWEAVALSPDGHPDKPRRLTNLGTGYTRRFKRLGELADIENSIASCEQALALTPDGHPDKPRRLTNLGAGYHVRFKRLGELTDLENVITIWQGAAALTPNGHPKKPSVLTDLGAGYYTRFEQLGELADLENGIASWQEAFALSPDGHPDKPSQLTNLGVGRRQRFERLGELVDLENSIASCEQAIALIPDGHPDKPILFLNLGGSFLARFERLGDVADLENSMARYEQATALSPDGHPDKPNHITNLGVSQHARFERLGELADLENSIARHKQALALTPDGHHDKPRRLANLGVSQHARFERLGELADLENSIARYEQALALTPDDHPYKSMHLSKLGISYSVRFERLGQLADAENSIARCEQAVALTPGGHPQKAVRLFNLGRAQTVAWNHTREKSHLCNALVTMQSAAQSPGGSPRVILEASRLWARLSLASGDIPSALEAFRTAIEILPQVAWLGLDIAARQEWLAKEKPEELGCQAATCAIWLGRCEEAVELLDMARSVFWQQASSVRSGLQDLKAEQPALADELKIVSRKLDTSSFSGLSTSDDDTQPYERRLADHRGLVLKRESLINEIRSLPGFEFFLKPTPFNRLREAAAAGLVVVVNISFLGADALVFDRTNPIRHIRLLKVDAAKSFKHTLKHTRDDDTQHDQELPLTLPELLDSIEVDALKPGNTTDLTATDGIEQEKARADVTEDRQTSQTLLRVWEHILMPIFTKVGIPLEPIKDQVPINRIFWYLTGPLTFIPIHAADLASQLVVSSYVTTLSSLAEAQKRQAEPISGPPRLLAIAQPNTPGLGAIPYATDEVNNVIDTLSERGWRHEHLQHFDRANATIDQVSTALDSCSWVHFACHAMQHASDGMESGFALHDGRLKLSAIAAKRLPSARFAFLSTCQSAYGLEDSPGEAMHLSAGMQFAGFSSVIATMTSIRDEDAPIVAKHTYVYLLRNGVDKIDLTEGAAALNHAVSQLRKDPNVTVERWAPFVYYGI